MARTEKIWAQKYRSNDLSNYICSPEFKETLQEWIKNKDFPHLTFYGLPGSGKTTLAKLLINATDSEYLHINCANERNIDVIREKVINFASTTSFSEFKTILLDEANYLTSTAQPALLNVIEEFSYNTRFLLTSNYLESIIPALRSRCTPILITPPSKRDVGIRVVEILKAENITYTLEDLRLIINECYPDIRTIINKCQIYIKDNTLKYYSVNNVSDIGDIISLVKSKKYENLRTKIQDSGNYDKILTDLYENINLLSDNPIIKASAIVIINEYLYKSQFIVDKEINCMSCLIQIIKLL